MEVRLSSDASSPSGREATALFSTLNSSSRTQFANELGMEPVDNRLYLQQEKRECF
jgi:hypothetical protein